MNVWGSKHCCLKTLNLKYLIFKTYWWNLIYSEMKLPWPFFFIFPSLSGKMSNLNRPFDVTSMGISLPSNRLNVSQVFVIVSECYPRRAWGSIWINAVGHCELRSSLNVSEIVGRGSERTNIGIESLMFEASGVSPWTQCG